MRGATEVREKKIFVFRFDRDEIQISTDEKPAMMLRRASRSLSPPLPVCVGLVVVSISSHKFASFF